MLKDLSKRAACWDNVYWCKRVHFVHIRNFLFHMTHSNLQLVTLLFVNINVTLPLHFKQDVFFFSVLHLYISCIICMNVKGHHLYLCHLLEFYLN